MKFKGENSNCYSTSATAPGGAATAELSGDRRDNEISVPVSSVTNNANDAAQMDIYRDLILRHLIQDINTTCTKLGLPTGHILPCTSSFLAFLKRLHDNYLM